MLNAVVVAADEEGVVDWVSEAAPKGPAAGIPGGHYGIIIAYADDFLIDAATQASRMIYAWALFDEIGDPDKANEYEDFYVLDVRQPVDFAGGHLPGAVNIPYESVAKAWNLSDLPTDKPILVVCYTGQPTNQVATVLNLLGYNAYALRFGQMSVAPITKMSFYCPLGVQPPADNEDPQAIYACPGLPSRRGPNGDDRCFCRVPG
jgi:rhodanese-related sulfurtransferase